MNASSSNPAVHLPRSAFSTLSQRCASLGDSGIKALREAGYRAGSEVLSAIGETPAELPSDEFWSRLDTSFQRAGLGSVSYEAISAEAGAVAWRESVEAISGDRTSVHCHFALGLLGGVLSRAAGRTVDVVEVQCGGGGSQPCWFVFGSVETLRAIRARVASLRIPSNPAVEAVER